MTTKTFITICLFGLLAPSSHAQQNSAEFIGDTAILVSKQTNISASWADEYVVRLVGVATAKKPLGTGYITKVYNLNTTYSIPGEYRKENEEKAPEE